MGRLFDDASTQYLELTSAPVTAAPLSFACWFRSDDATVSQTLVGLTLSSGTAGFALVAAGAVASDPVRFQSRNGATIGNADTSTGYSANVWHHAAGTTSATNSRSSYIDGGSKTTNTTSVTPASPNRTNVGCGYVASSRVGFASGKIAHAAIWSVALTDAEVALLARGYPPYLIQRASLVAYWPLFGTASPETDIIGANNLTVSGATDTDEPPRFNFDSLAALQAGVL